MTLILKINNKKPELQKIKKAAKVLKSGGLVAFPTETVYGLGADTFNKNAVRKIYKVKGRPFDNPSIVHIADKKDIRILANEVPKGAEKLIKKFWPGPLTIILKKKKTIPNIVTAGLGSVAIRMPKNKIALTLIKEAKTPIAAPSANKSGKPSPTSASHVISDLDGKVDLIIDGGCTKIGLESTVVDFTQKNPVILRPGGYSFEELKKITRNLRINRKNTKQKAKSPGMKYKHYSPNAEVMLLCGKPLQIKNKIKKILKSSKRPSAFIGKEHIDGFDFYFTSKNPRIIAKNLFKKFREFDEKGATLIVVQDFEEKGIGLALMNRLRKAADKFYI